MREVNAQEELDPLSVWVTVFGFPQVKNLLKSLHISNLFLYPYLYKIWYNNRSYNISFYCSTQVFHNSRRIY